LAIYNYITQGQLIQEVANRLYDPTMTFWTSDEIYRYFKEALRTWNALTGYWRGDFTFQSKPGVTWYDLTDTVAMPNTLRPISSTGPALDANLYVLMQYHLLEPPLGINPWPSGSPSNTGSLQFTSDDFLNAVQRRRDEILSITSCTLTRRTIPAVAGRITLPDTVIDVRRLAYLPAAFQAGGYGVGAYGMGPYGYSAYNLSPASVVWPEDTWAEQAFNNRYTLAPAGTPLAYLLSTQPPISFDVDTPPGGAGTYELLTVEAGPALSITTPSLLSIPDDWAYLIKWGALADLLSRESLAKDIPRAAYCEQQYRLGLAVMLQAPALLAMRIDNVPLQIDSVRSADLYNTSWQGQAQQKPRTALHAGLNLIALAPAPDLIYSMTATVVQNAPVPVAASDPVQVSRDDLDVIIDYTQHLAAFKQGGDEFARTMPLMQRFLKQAAYYNGKLAELGEYTSMLLDQSQRERDTNPLATPSAEQEVTS